MEKKLERTGRKWTMYHRPDMRDYVLQAPTRGGLIVRFHSTEARKLDLEVLMDNLEDGEFYFEVEVSPGA